MDTSIFEELGLRNAEIKIYIALLELGTSTAGPIVKKTGLQNSVVHLTLPKLAEKGFISYTKKGGRKIYTATNPKNINKFIEDKKRKYNIILPELLAKQKQTQIPEAEIYEGLQGLRLMHTELIKDSKPGDEYLFFAFYTKDEDMYKKVANFYIKEYHPDRIKKKLNIKGLISPEVDFTKDRFSREVVRFTDFPILKNISIFKDKVIMTPWEDGQTSFMIRSKQLAEEFRQYFYSIWKVAKPKP